MRDELARSEVFTNKDQLTTCEPLMFGMAVDEENAIIGTEVTVEESVEGKVVAIAESACEATGSVELL